MKLNGDDDEYDDDFYDEDDDLKMSHMKKRSQKRIFLERKINRLLTKKEEEDYQLKKSGRSNKSHPDGASLLHAEMLLQWKFV